jgi:GR25 family glycosyltransferase involved in LPS biosynthesis
MKGHSVSEAGYKALVESSKAVKNDFTIERFDAILSDNVDAHMEKEGLKWTWPDSGTTINQKLNMRFHAYGGPPKRRHACAMSHFYLWKKCVEESEPILILEHDAIFTKKLDPDYILDSDYECIGINDPRGATRLANKFHNIVQSAPGPLVDCPIIDNMQVPQGIAGASAYIIKPEGADQAIGAAYDYGLWPNDALLCQQLFSWLGVTKTYYTTVQGLKSTTFTGV